MRYITAMKTAFFFLTVAVAGLLGASILPSSHAADSGSCYGVTDADMRAYCLAKAHADPGRCYSIQRADLRAQCLAEVRR